MTIVRLGLGQTSSGKILDKQTHWYVLENDKNDKNEILKDVNISLNKPIFISRNKTKYEEITYNELVNLINKV